MPYKLTPEGRARKNAVSKTYYARNKDKIIAKNSTPEKRAAKTVYMRGWVAKNREKRRAYAREYQREYRKRAGVKERISKAPSNLPENRHWRQIWEKYKLTEEAFNALCAAQDQKCAICERDFTESGGTRPTVDHDHGCCFGRYTCGNCIRGLLCHDCNTAIGKLGDSLSGLMKAIAYLTQYGLRRIKKAV